MKKRTIFIQADNSEVYLVSGIISSWEEMLLCGRPLPVIIETVLIPFRNAIISDGLVSVSNIFFGKNLRSEFKDIYLFVKKTGNIHSSL